MATSESGFVRLYAAVVTTLLLLLLVASMRRPDPLLDSGVGCSGDIVDVEMTLRIKQLEDDLQLKEEKLRTAAGELTALKSRYQHLNRTAEMAKKTADDKLLVLQAKHDALLSQQPNRANETARGDLSESHGWRTNFSAILPGPSFGELTVDYSLVPRNCSDPHNPLYRPFFLHMRKAGGSTIRLGVLGLIADLHLNREEDGDVAEYLHFSAKTIRKKKRTLITNLRKPIDRILSQYSTEGAFGQVFRCKF